MDKIKICALTTKSLTMEAFVLDSMKYLNQKGFEVTLICDMDETFIKMLPDSIKYINIPMARKVDFIGGIKAFLKIYKIFKKNKYDIIQYATPNASFYASLAGWLAQIPVRIYCQWGIRYVGFSGIRREFFKLFEKATCIFSTHIRSASYKNMEFAIQERLYKKLKCAVIGKGGTIGVDLNKFDLNKKEEYRKEIRKKYKIGNEKVFGFIGSIRKDKGVNELLTAFKELCDKYDNILLMMIGSEFSGDPIKKELCEWSKRSNKIIYCGKVNEIYKFLAAVDIVVHPSYREGFSMVLQESSAMELPIITTDIPGPSEVICNEKTGLLVPIKDSNALKNKMEYLLKNENLCKIFGVAGRKRVEKYFRREDRLELIYQDIMNIINEKKKR